MIKNLVTTKSEQSVRVLAETEMFRSFAFNHSFHFSKSFSQIMIYYIYQVPKVFTIVSERNNVSTD